MKFIVVTRDQTGKIEIHEFPSREAALTFAQTAKWLGLEILIGWGEK